jgi:hypothetical protein
MLPLNNKSMPLQNCESLTYEGLHEHAAERTKSMAAKLDPYIPLM